MSELLRALTSAPARASPSSTSAPTPGASSSTRRTRRAAPHPRRHARAAAPGARRRAATALSTEAIERTLDALRDFRAIALGAGATRIVAVATAAMREPQNGAALHRARAARARHRGARSSRRARRPGTASWARCTACRSSTACSSTSAAAACRSRASGTGARARRSLPLGALRLSDAFLARDPPERRRAARLREHVRERSRGGVAPLSPGEQLVGTGGTVRNLAKMDRRSRGYPITRLHGYVLARRRVHGTSSRCWPRVA